MRVLVSGTTGQLGKRIASELSAKHEIIALSRDGAPVSGAARSHRFDLRDNASQAAAIFKQEQPQAVVHLGALVGKVCETQATLAYQINVQATRQLAHLAVKHNVEVFTFASSAAVYYQSDYSPTDEMTNVAPRTVYGKTKLAAEAILAKCAESGGPTRFASLRIFNPYGPGISRSLVNQLIAARQEAPVQLPGWSDYHSDYVHVDDVVNAVESTLNNATLGEPYSVFNIGSGTTRSNQELINDLSELGYNPRYIPGQQQSYSWANIDRARQHLSFNPQTDLAIDF